jgi:hypothetical protein
MKPVELISSRGKENEGEDGGSEPNQSTLQEYMDMLK